MKVYTINQYDAKIRKNIRRLITSPNEVTHKAASYCINVAGLLAPYKKGGIRENLYVRKSKYGHTAISATRSKSGFPYQFWVNQEKGFTPINAFGHTMSQYGHYPNWRWTAKGKAIKEGYFNVAVDLAKQVFKVNANKSLKFRD